MKEKEELVYQCTSITPEKEVEEILADVQTLAEMHKVQSEFLRHALEKYSPTFAAFMREYLQRSIAQSETLLKIQGEFNTMLKEFFAYKFGGVVGHG